jgi:hypothetical protein
MTPNPKKVTRNCVVCGKPFEAWAKRSRNLCSDACEHKHKFVSEKTVLYKTCVTCKKEFVTNRSKKTVCTECVARSNERIAARKKKEANRNYFPEKKCLVCGSVFVDSSLTRNKKVCSRKCTHKADRDKHNYSAKRRAIIFGANHIPYSRADVFERDGYTCYLCGLPLDMTSTMPAYFSATVDHVVPLSRGGQDNLSNVRAAHLICNMRKSNRV